jgi:hypothetical protein
MLTAGLVAKLAENGMLGLDDLQIARLRRHLRDQVAGLDLPDQDPDWVAARRRFFEGWDDAFWMLCEAVASPIEQLLGAYLMGINDGYNEVWYDTFPGAFPEPDFGTLLRVQQDFAGYRIDFAFKLLCRGAVKVLAVHCDEEQAQRDCERDRRLQLAGVTSIRFTSSEISRDPEGCAEQVQAQLARMMGELLAEQGLGPKPHSPQLPD